VKAEETKSTVEAGNLQHVLQETTNDLHHVEMQLAGYVVNVEGALVSYAVTVENGGFAELFGGCAVGFSAYHLPSVQYRFAKSIAMQPWHPPWLNSHNIEGPDLWFVSALPPDIDMLPWK